MQLYYSTRSPFVRKVLVCAHEVGLLDRIECVSKVVTARTNEPEVCARNPLGQIPTLILDDGSALYDSTVICEWLSQHKPDLELVPNDPIRRIEVAYRHAQANGLLDTLIRWLGERRRTPDDANAELISVARNKLQRVCTVWEQAVAGWDGRPVDLGFITIGCALAYTDFRFGEEEWRSGRPELQRWFEGMSLRASFRATQFHDPNQT